MAHTNPAVRGIHSAISNPADHPDEFHIRVGSDQYAKEDESYGLPPSKKSRLYLV